MFISHLDYIGGKSLELFIPEFLAKNPVI